MIPQTNIIYNTSDVADAITGADTGDWFAFQSDGRTHNVFSVNFIAGTGDVKLQGRVDSLSPATDVITLSASGSELVAKFHQYRVVVASGVDLQTLVTLDKPGRIVS